MNLKFKYENIIIRFDKEKFDKFWTTYNFSLIEKRIYAFGISLYTYFD